MRFCYADPPYVGQARKHYAKEAAAQGRVAAEVDHVQLFSELNSCYDGWALSASSPSLFGPHGLCAIAPDGTRMGGWFKPFASFKRGVDPAYAWEPVLFKSCRAWRRDQRTCRDWAREDAAPDCVGANITLKRGTSGAKPERFSMWLFDLLGMNRYDEFTDLFPGSGAVTLAWDKWRGQLEAIA